MKKFIWIYALTGVLLIALVAFLVLTLGKNENCNPVNDDNVQIVRKYEILKRDISYGIKTTAKFKVIDENSK